MDTKFTPGPWRSWKDDYQNVWFVGKTDYAVARMWHCNEREANMHLVEAAPIMYDALEAAEIALLINSDDSAALADALRVVTFALKQARGENK